jgi:PAS domain S-box-containing protein
MSVAVNMRRFSLSALVGAGRRAAIADGTETPLVAPFDAASAELARVRASEARLRKVIDIAPVLIWMSGPDTLVTYVNKHWLTFTGRPLNAERGHGWMDSIHAEDLRQYERIYEDAFLHQRPFQAEFRMRRSDGSYRWLLDAGTPIHDEMGLFAGYVGSCLDITDSKAAKQELATVSGRLIEAQEQERSRLARELHDDINQRLALLAIEIEQLRLDPPNVRKELAKGLDGLQQATLSISRDVQALSHELHSSKLDFLGMVPAFSSFCREFSQKKKVHVQFTHADVPPNVPRDTSLCMFRVLQEASHNVVKHSGVQRFDVELRGTADHVHLSVRDAGNGFDPSAAINTRGLGLVSMRERLSLIGGTLAIRSGLDRGTEVFAEVPVSGVGMVGVRLRVREGDRR